MSTHDLSFLSRANLEQVFAAVLFGATVALVASGVLAMSLRAAFAV